MYRFAKSLRKADPSAITASRPPTVGGKCAKSGDSKVVRQKRCHDWHRVERARRVFTIKLDLLRQEGWQDI